MNTHAAWAHPALAAQVLRLRHDGGTEVALRVDGLHDARRRLHLGALLQAVPGVQRVSIDAAAERVRIIWDASRLSLPQLLDACAANQYAAQPLRRDSIDDPRADETRDALKRLLVAGMFAMQVMTYAFVMYIGAVDMVDASTRGLFRWLSLLSTAPVVFYAAQPFFRGALRELRQRRLGIDLPVALAVALVFLASGLNTLRGHGEIYFDSIGMFVFLLLGGRYLELRARHRSGALGDAVVDAAPLLAERRRTDGALETVSALELLPGDRVHLAEGSKVPADGVLESACVHVDESLLSGESRPLRRQRGERLIAGSVLLDGPAELRVEHGGERTLAARLAMLAQHAGQARGVRATDNGRDITRFVARVLTLTALTALGWWLVNPSRAFDAAVAVLVVACPCAYALAWPAAMARAFGALAQRGVLVVDSGALATLATVDFALFDKTGTLTVPHIDRAAIESLRGDPPEQLLRLAATLAQESSHPLARALMMAGTDQQPSTTRAHALHIVAGAGIGGEVDGRTMRLGRASFAIASSGPPMPYSDSGLVLADADGALAVFHVDEPLRPGTAHTIATLQADGVATAIASGDAPARVAAIAGQLGIADWHARQNPADKLHRLQAARAAGHITLAVGDGSNDAPLLSGADVSAAVSGGTGLAQAHADLLLMNGRLDGLVFARQIAQKMQLVMAQGRRGSLLYNLCAVPFAALGFVPPWLAAIGMSLSSLAVVLNALRIGRDGARCDPALRNAPSPRAARA